MKPRVALVKPTKTSREIKNVYFDQEVLKLLDDINGREEWICQRIARALVPNNFDKFPYYISRIRYISDTTDPNFGRYQILYTDSFGPAKTTIIDLTTCIEVSNQPTDIPLEGVPDPKLEDVLVFPDQFNRHNNLSQFLFLGLNTQIKKFEELKEQDHDLFYQGKREINSPLPPKQTIKNNGNRRIYTDEDYSLDEAKEIFHSKKVPLKTLVDNFDKARKTKEEFEKIEQEIENELVMERISLASPEGNEIKKILGQDYNNGHLKGSIERVSENVEKMETEIKNDIKDAYLKYQNTKEQLAVLKRHIGWALYAAAHDYYINEVQEKTKGDATTRSAKINSFNKHFLGLVQIGQDGTLTNIEIIYENLKHKSLTEVSDFVNYILKEANTSTMWSSDKLIALISTLQKVAQDLQELMGLSDDLKMTMRTGQPYLATPKGYLGAKKAKFAWDESIKTAETEATTDVDTAKKRLENVDKYQDIIQPDIKNPNIIPPIPLVSNITVNANNLNTLKRNYQHFQLFMADLRKLREAKISANSTIEEANKLFSEMDVMIRDIQEMYDKLDTFKRTHTDSPLKPDTNRDELGLLIETKKNLFSKLKKLTDSVYTINLDSDLTTRKDQILTLEQLMKSIEETSNEIESIKNGSCQNGLSNLKIRVNNDLLDTLSVENKENLKGFKLVIENELEKLSSLIKTTFPLYYFTTLSSFLETSPNKILGNKAPSVLVELVKNLQQNIKSIDAMRQRYEDESNVVLNNIEQDNMSLKNRVQVSLEIHNKLKVGILIDKQHRQLIYELQSVNNILSEPTAHVDSIKRSLPAKIQRDDRRFINHVQTFQGNKELIKIALEVKGNVETPDYTDPAIINGDKNAIWLAKHRCFQAYYHIKSFPDLLNLQSELERINHILPKPENLKREVSHIDPDNHELLNQIEHYEKLVKLIAKLGKKYGKCDMDKFDEELSIEQVKEALYEYYNEAEQTLKSIQKQIKQKTEFVFFKLKIQADESNIEKAKQHLLKIFALNLHDQVIDSLSEQYNQTIQEYNEAVANYKDKDSINSELQADLESVEAKAAAIAHKLYDIFYQIERRLAVQHDLFLDYLPEFKPNPELVNLLQHDRKDEQIRLFNPENEEKPEINPVKDNAPVLDLDPNLTNDFFNFYTQLQDCIRILESKYADLKSIKDKNKLTRTDTEQKLSIVESSLFELKKLRVGIETDLMDPKDPKFSRNQLRKDISRLKQEIADLQKQKAVGKEAKGKKAAEIKEKSSELNILDAAYNIQDKDKKYKQDVIHNPQDLSHEYLYNHARVFNAITTSFNSALEHHLEDKQSYTSGFRYWLTRFRERFVDGMRWVTAQHTELSPENNYSTIGISKILAKTGAKLFGAFTNKHKPVLQYLPEQPSVPSDLDDEEELKKKPSKYEASTSSLKMEEEITEVLSISPSLPRKDELPSMPNSPRNSRKNSPNLSRRGDSTIIRSASEDFDSVPIDTDKMVREINELDRMINEIYAIQDSEIIENGPYEEAPNLAAPNLDAPNEEPKREEPKREEPNLLVLSNREQEFPLEKKKKEKKDKEKTINITEVILEDSDEEVMPKKMDDVPVESTSKVIPGKKDDEEIHPVLDPMPVESSGINVQEEWSAKVKSILNKDASYCRWRDGKEINFDLQSFNYFTKFLTTKPSDLGGKPQAVESELNLLEAKNPKATTVEEFRKKIFEAYNWGQINLFTLIQLNRLIAPPTKAITGDELQSEIREYETQQGKGFWRRLKGNTQTVNDCKFLIKELANHEKKDAGSVAIYASDIEVILKLRDNRDSMARVSYYKGNNVGLFQNKTQLYGQLSHTELFVVGLANKFNRK